MNEAPHVFTELLRDTVEELSICDEDDLARCGLPSGRYGTRVHPVPRANGSTMQSALIVRLGVGDEYQLTVTRRTSRGVRPDK